MVSASSSAGLSEDGPAGQQEGRSWQFVVLNWNGRDDTLRCLDSLARVRRPCSVVCVDNGSEDGSQQAIRAGFPSVELIEAGTNLGYSGGNNLGVRRALECGAAWIVLVNNDATVASDVIEGFEAALSQVPAAGILAGKVMFADRPDRVWFAGQRVATRVGYSGRPRGYGRRDSDRYSRVQRTDRAVGALMAISREVVHEVGLLDEQLFAYVEDVDWALRARSAGFEVIFAPAARAWHRVSAATGGAATSTYTLYYGTRNTIVVLERHRQLGVLGTHLRRAAILISFGMHALTRADRRAALRAVRRGFDDALSGRLGERPPEP